jgi:hypothetical protein
MYPGDLGQTDHLGLNGYATVSMLYQAFEIRRMIVANCQLQSSESTEE